MCPKVATRRRGLSAPGLNSSKLTTRELKCQTSFRFKGSSMYTYVYPPAAGISTELLQSLHTCTWFIFHSHWAPATGLPHTAQPTQKFIHLVPSRLLDICHGQRREREMSLYLVFEHVHQDLASYLEKCPPPGLAPDRIKVRRQTGVRLVIAIAKRRK